MPRGEASDVTSTPKKHEVRFVHFGEHTEPRKRGAVLVVDDAEDNRDLVRYLVERFGAEFVPAETAEEGIRLARSGSFDLILMDVHLPGMDGFTATQRLREQGCAVPIVALTATSPSLGLRESVAAGCTKYFVKPFEQDRFFELLDRYLPPPGGGGEVREPPATSKQRGPSSNGAHRQYPELVRRFSEGLHAKLSAIETAWQAGDLGQVKLLSHRLASADMFGFPELGEVARSLEDAARLGVREKCREEVERLQAAGQAILS